VKLKELLQAFNFCESLESIISIKGASKAFNSQTPYIYWTLISNNFKFETEGSSENIVDECEPYLNFNVEDFSLTSVAEVMLSYFNQNETYHQGSKWRIKIKLNEKS
jgi:hypothetical protein